MPPHDAASGNSADESATVPADASAALPAEAAHPRDDREALEDHDRWLDETEELPARQRRRLLGSGANLAALALLALLLVACGFIAGVLVEKSQGGTGSTTGGASALASRLSTLRGGSPAARSGGAGALASLFGPGGAGRPTAGTISYLAGTTLYVTNSEGNTIKVTTSPATTVSKTVQSKVDSIHPGEAVTITGTTGANGSVSAEAISVGAEGSFAPAALFGRSGGGDGGGEPALFGSRGK